MTYSSRQSAPYRECSGVGYLVDAQQRCGCISDPPTPHASVYFNLDLPFTPSAFQCWVQLLGGQAALPQTPPLPLRSVQMRGRWLAIQRGIPSRIYALMCLYRHMPRLAFGHCVSFSLTNTIRYLFCVICYMLNINKWWW